MLVYHFNVKEDSVLVYHFTVKEDRRIGCWYITLM